MYGAVQFSIVSYGALFREYGAARKHKASEHVVSIMVVIDCSFNQLA